MYAALKKLILFGIFITPFFAKAQGGFVIGYNIGSFRQAQRIPQAYAQSFNAQSGDKLIQKMKFNGFYRGLTFGFKTGGESWLFGMRWSTKKATSNTGENDVLSQRIRIRQNTVGVEFGMVSEFVKLGASLDAGVVKVQREMTDKTTNESTGWEGYYEGSTLFNSGSTVAAFSFFVDFQLGPFVEFRPYYQLPISQTQILDKRTLRSYVYRTHNFGFSLSLVLFGND